MSSSSLRWQLHPSFVPSWILSIAAACNATQPRDLDMAELFCGEGQLSAAFERSGFRTASLDREHGPSEDLSNLTGLKYAISIILRLKPSGLLWLGPPCKNWVFLSSPQHKRKRDNFFLGDVASNSNTAEANSLLYTVAGLIRLAVALGVHYIIEQPIDSRMLDTMCMMKVRRMTHASQISTYLSAFCADFQCMKGLHLCGTAPILRALRRNATRTVASDNIYVKDDFTGSVTGGPDLEKTQHYPREFGEAARALVHQNLATPM